MIAVGLFNFRSAYAENDIQWDMQELFERKSQNENITEILRQISKRNKMQLVILPGVQGTVTFDFVHFPLKGVFNLIITEHGLDYRYDKSTNTLTVSNRGDPMLRAGPSDAPTKQKPEPSSAADDAIKAAERELDEMIQKEQLATRFAETQIRQFKELEAQRLVVYRAEASVNRLFQSGASLQKQIGAAEEAKKQANAYLALQAKHEEELGKLRAGEISSEPKLKAGILKPPPAITEFLSGKRTPNKIEADEHKLVSQKKLDALEKRIKTQTETKKKKEFAAKRRRKEQEERIAELTKASERLDQELREARLKLKTSARKQARRIFEMRAQVLAQRNLRTEAELKERLAKGKLERERLQLAASRKEASQTIAQIELEAKIRGQNDAEREATLKAEREKIGDSQKRMAAELRLKEKQLAKSELELQATLNQARQTQKQASLENKIKAKRQENREKELEAKLEQVRRSQKQAELQGMIDAEKDAQRERELQLKFERMQHAQAQARLQAKLDIERQTKREQELLLKLERMQHVQAQAELQANIDVEKQTQRARELETTLERLRREKVAAELQVAKEMDLALRRKAEADELREISERKNREKQKLEAEKLRMLSELAAHKEELERLKKKNRMIDELKLVQKVESNSQSISANSFEALTATRKPIDATWLFKLTGIGRSAGSLYATVDGKDYKIGDRLAGMKIVKIERDQVLCIKQTKDGLIPYVVGFRR